MPQTVQPEVDLMRRLHRLAKSSRCCSSSMAGEAIREFVEHNDWQIKEIYAAVEEANAGDFASSRDFAALVGKWQIKVR